MIQYIDFVNENPESLSKLKEVLEKKSTLIIYNTEKHLHSKITTLLTCVKQLQSGSDSQFGHFNYMEEKLSIPKNFCLIMLYAIDLMV